MKISLGLKFILLFFSFLSTSCGCPQELESFGFLYKDAIITLFNNEHGNELFEDGTAAYCSADNLGISVKYLDSLESYEKIDKICWKLEPLNPPRQLYIYSTFQFLSKIPGEDLKDYFLISFNRKSFPYDLNSQSFADLGKMDFILLLKPEIGLEEHSIQRFIVELQTDNKVFRDTTMTVILQ